MVGRTLAQFQPTDGEIALNAYIFGFAGHSLVTPHSALKQLWWTEQRINAKVTKAFIISKLRGEERTFLARSPLFGDLTDHSYLEWILAKAKRLFLILLEVGIPDQIFGCIDDSWTDEDLPISLEDIPRLELSYDDDDSLNQRFYSTQYRYLLRTLHNGEHIDYGLQEHIPIEYVSTLPAAASIQSWDRVHLPEAENVVYVRRKFSLVNDIGLDVRESSCKDIRQAQGLAHRHIAPIWASYTSEDTGYILSDFVPEHTLKSFIQHRTPTQLVRLAPTAQIALLGKWMHCLADAVALMQSRSHEHGSIRPSNILIDSDNNICFADIGLATMQQNKKNIKNEEYDYSAPETHVQSWSVFRVPNHSMNSLFSFSRRHKASISTSSSSCMSDTSSTREWRGCSTETSRTSLSSRPSCNYSLPSLSFDQSSLLSECTSPSLTFSASGRYQSDSFVRSQSSTFSRSTYSGRSTSSSSSAGRAEAKDIYSLGCVYLDILTFMMRGKLNDFIKFRSSKVSSEGSRSYTDSSFHANQERVSSWTTLLAEESLQHTDAMFLGVPAMLRLVEQMLMPNALLRPTACQTRDRLLDILTITCGVEKLCCTDRSWN